MFAGWSDFFMLIGTAAAGLIGLLFVVATLTAGNERSQAMRGAALYLSPTVGLFGVALFISALALAPGLPAWLTALLIIGVSAGGLAYAIRSHRGIRAFRTDAEPPHWSDAWFYGVCPGVIYAGLAAGAMAMAFRANYAAPVIGGMLLALLFTGIRNAWDLVTWLAPRRPDAPPT